MRLFSKEFILEGISTVLKENTFHFDGNLYKHLQKTTMGTKMAPKYATLVMGYLEKQLYGKYETTYGGVNKEGVMKKFKRFLDECFFPWNDNEDKLNGYHSLLNSLRKKIKFTVEKGDKELPFLDVLLYKKGTRQHTNMFYKEIDAHQYLYFKSSHPKHIKQSIPYSLERRICSIVSKTEVRDRRLQKLMEFLLQQI